jgi:hypothetical protein
MRIKNINLKLSFDRSKFDRLVFDDDENFDGLSTIETMLDLNLIDSYTYKEISSTNYEYIYEFSIVLKKIDDEIDELIIDLESLDFVNYVKIS